MTIHLLSNPTGINAEHYRGGTAALKFLREHETRVFSGASFEPEKLQHAIVGLGPISSPETKAFLHVISMALSELIIGTIPEIERWTVFDMLQDFRG